MEFPAIFRGRYNPFKKSPGVFKHRRLGIPVIFLLHLLVVKTDTAVGSGMTFCSTAHGSGRTMSGTKAKKSVRGARIAEKP